MRGAAGKRIVYVADVCGYLYEWYIAAKPNLYTRLGKIIPESWKMGIVRYAMAKPGSHLPGSYEPPVPEQGGEHHE
jgi:hypothetical protein